MAGKQIPYYSLGVARGPRGIYEKFGILTIANYAPFNATVFFFTDWIAASGMTVLPPLRIGVTLTSSHSIGTFTNKVRSSMLLMHNRVTYASSSVDILDRLADFGTNTYKPVIIHIPVSKHEQSFTDHLRE